MNDSPSTRQHAYMLLEIGRAEEALTTLARDFDAEDPWSWHARAAALLALDRHEEAARAAEEGLTREPEHPYLFDALAAARVGLGELAGAEEAILSALRIDSEDADFLTRYAHVVARVGQLEKAEKLVMRALAIDPENTFALQMHALLATARDDRAEAIARSHELLRHVPENPIAHRLLGAAHAEQGRAGAAADHLRRAVMFDPSDEGLAEAAREARRRSHWLLLPLWPVMRWGAAPVWIAVMVAVFSLKALKLERAMTLVLIVWIVYCVYSWIIPSIVRRLTARG